MVNPVFAPGVQVEVKQRKSFRHKWHPLATCKSRASKEKTPGNDNKCDMIAQVSDSIEIVKNILSELEI